MDLELWIHRTGAVFLSRYDSINGKDRVFQLYEGGKVCEAMFDADDQPTYMLVDLVAELRELAIGAHVVGGA